MVQEYWFNINDEHKQVHLWLGYCLSPLPNGPSCSSFHVHPLQGSLLQLFKWLRIAHHSLLSLPSFPSSLKNADGQSPESSRVANLQGPHNLFYCFCCLVCLPVSLSLQLLFPPVNKIFTSQALIEFKRYQVFYTPCSSVPAIFLQMSPSPLPLIIKISTYRTLLLSVLLCFCVFPDVLSESSVLLEAGRRGLSHIFRDEAIEQRLKSWQPGSQPEWVRGTAKNRTEA